MGIGGAAFLEGSGENGEKNDAYEEEGIELNKGVNPGSWGNANVAAERISATNDAAANDANMGTFRPTFLQQAGLHPEAYLSR